MDSSGSRAARLAEHYSWHRMPARRRSPLIRLLSAAAALFGLSLLPVAVSRAQGQAAHPSIDADRQATPEAVPPPANLVGQVTADEPAAVRDLEVRVVTSTAAGTSRHRQLDSRTMGTVQTVRTDSQGRFEVRGIRAGLLRIDVLENEKFSRLAIPPLDVLLAPGSTTRIEIPLRKAVRISGRVLDRKSRRPVPATLFARSRDGREVSRETNPKGEFSFLALPGQLSLYLSPLPRAPLADSLTVKDGESQTVPDILCDGYRLSGRTVGADGKPMGGIHVDAFWYGGDELHQNLAQSAQSATDGLFSIPGVPPDKKVALHASLSGVEVMSPLTLNAPPWQSLTLSVRGLEPVILSGKVNDAAGHPVPNAGFRVRMFSRSGPNQMSICVVDEGTADKQGRFATTKKHDRHATYQAEAVIGGRTRGETDPFIPAKAGSNEFPTIVVRTAPTANPAHAGPKAVERATLVGRVVDQAGRPVPDARLIVWSEARRSKVRSSANGDFSIPNLPREGVLLFVDARDFSFHGQWAEPGPSPVKIVLSLRGNPTVPLRPLPDPPLPEEVLQQAWQAFRPVKDQLFKELAKNGKIEQSIGEWELLKLAGRFEPERTLKFIGTHRFRYDWLPDYVRAVMAGDRTAGSPDAALKLVEQIGNPCERCWRLCDFAKDAPRLESVQRQRLLERAYGELPQIPAKSQAESLVRLARVWRELNRPELARKFLDEAESRLPPGGDSDAGDRANFVRGWFAIEKARLEGTDTTRFLSATEGNFEYNRYCGAIAQAIAVRHPETAERLFATLRGGHNWTARVCYELAKVDQPRAERLARAEVEPDRRAYALGMVAFVVAPKDKLSAVRLLDEAYGILQTGVDGNDQGLWTIQRPVSTALGLLDVVEHVDPALGREFFWRALSLRTTRTFGSLSMLLGTWGGEECYSDPVLAACVARYDRDLAQHILRPPGDESVAEGAQSYPHYYYFFASAIFDPQETINATARLPRGTQGERVTSDHAWCDLFASLTTRGEARWKLLREHQMFLWRIGDDDF